MDILSVFDGENVLAQQVQANYMLITSKLQANYKLAQLALLEELTCFAMCSLLFSKPCGCCFDLAALPDGIYSTSCEQ